MTSTRRCDRGSRPHANGLACQTAFTKEVAGSQNRDDRLFADVINDGELYTACLQVHYALSGITLRVDDLCFFKLYNFSRHPGRIEKSLGIESDFRRGYSFGFDLVEFAIVFITPPLDTKRITIMRLKHD